MSPTYFLNASCFRRTIKKETLCQGDGKVRAEWTNRAEAKGEGHPKLYVYTARVRSFIVL